MSNETVRALDALNVPADQQSQVIALLDERAKGRPEDRRQADHRYRYTGQIGLTIQVTHPGGNQIELHVFPRDLSEKGMGFFHFNFLYPQSECTLWIPDADGQLLSVQGHITRCELVKGRVHDVGMVFNSKVELARFTDIQVEEEAPVAKPEYKWRRSAKSA